MQGGPKIAASFIQQKDTKEKEDTKTGFFNNSSQLLCITFHFFCGNLNYDRLEHFKDIFKVIFHFSSHLDTLKVDIKASKLTLGTNDGESKSMYFNLLY